MTHSLANTEKSFRRPHLISSGAESPIIYAQPRKASKAPSQSNRPRSKSNQIENYSKQKQKFENEISEISNSSTVLPPLTVNTKKPVLFGTRLNYSPRPKWVTKVEIIRKPEKS